MIVPQHIGIIMDGNRRWARGQGISTLEGHKKGVEALERTLKLCRDYKIKILTVFAFSTENWQRPKKEVDYLMKLFLDIFSKKRVKSLQENKIKLNVLGQRERFPQKLQQKMQQAEAATKQNKNFILNIALSYGGRADIVQAVKNIFQKGIKPGAIDENLISRNLYTQGLPEPDLIIRTGKQKRLSNFLIWQAAYSELYFSDKHWPEFNRQELEKALKDYAKRKRNFGR